jgi:hypothetical protein
VVVVVTAVIVIVATIVVIVDPSLLTTPAMQRLLTEFPVEISRVTEATEDFGVPGVQVGDRLVQVRFWCGGWNRKARASLAAQHR